MSAHLRQIWKVAPCLMSIIVDYMGFGLVYPIVTSMFTQGGTSIFPHLGSEHLRDFYLGLAYLLYPLGMFFGASFLGDLSDLWGRRKVILFSVGGICISFLVMSFGVIIRNVFLFLFGRLLSGLMAGSQPLSQAAVADISTSSTKAWNMNAVTFVNALGLVFGPIIAGVFSESWFIKDAGYSPPFLFAALIAAVTFFWIFSKFKETYYPSKKMNKIQWIRPMRIFIEAFSNKKVRLLALTVLFFQFGLAAYFQMIGVYFSVHFHYSNSLIGFFYVYLGSCFAIGTLFAYPLAIKYFKYENLILVGLFGQGILECIVAFISVDWIIWIIIFGIGIFNILAWSPLLTIFSNSVDESKQGWVMGIFSSMVAVGFILAGLTSNLLPWIASNHIVFIGGIFVIVSALLIVLYRIHYLKPKKHAKAH